MVEDLRLAVRICNFPLIIFSTKNSDMIDVRYLNRLIEAVSEEVPTLKVGLKKDMYYSFLKERGELKVVAGDRTVVNTEDDLRLAIVFICKFTPDKNRFLWQSTYPFLISLFKLYGKDYMKSLPQLKKVVAKVVADYYTFHISSDSFNTYEKQQHQNELQSTISDMTLERELKRSQTV